MGLAPATKKVVERIYQFVAPFLIGLGVYMVYKQGKQIEAVLLALIGFAAVFYYWIKFFKMPPSQANDVWPPFVSTCPDYLTLITSPSDGESYCMDFVGVSLNPAMMKKTDPNNIPTTADPDFESYVFRVKGLTDNADPADKTRDLCNNVRRRGLTWAHICDE
jgi:hypothetical protein